MPELSIIIPVYNTESYLEKCLASVAAQTFTDMEIICVDDGSTDGCLQMLKAFAAVDERVRVIHKENGGLVSARKAGVEVASGKYIGCVDSDDWVEPEMYGRLYQEALDSRAELVSSGYMKEGAYHSIHFDALPEGRYSEEQMDFVREHIFYCMEKREPGMRGSLCCKLFLLEKYKEVQRQLPDRLSFSEDKLCVLMYLLSCRSVSILKEAYYHYRIHRQSMINAPDADYLLRIHEVYQCVSRLYGREGFTESMRLQAEVYITELLLLGINKRLGFQHKNMLWIDPCWLEAVPKGARLVLYGAGEAGETYKRQLKGRPDIQYMGCVDFHATEVADGTDRANVSGNRENRLKGSLKAWPVSDLKDIDFDCIFITVKDPLEAKRIKKQLEGLSIAPERILWKEQKELFWKYLQAEGLCGGEGENWSLEN